MTDPARPTSVRCPRCGGKGRVRNHPIDAAEWVFTAGIAPVIRLLLESDPWDDRFWSDCPKCGGSGRVMTR